MEPRWLDFARRIQAIAQTGLHYNPQSYDREHYEKLREIAAEMLAAGSNAGEPQVLNLLEREKGHATPKVDVRGVVFRAGRILLVRELLDAIAGRCLAAGRRSTRRRAKQPRARCLRRAAGACARRGCWRFMTGGCTGIRPICFMPASCSSSVSCWTRRRWQVVGVARPSTKQGKQLFSRRKTCLQNFPRGA